VAYSKVLHVHHGGRVESSSCGVEFEDMTCEVLFFPWSPSPSEVAAQVKATLGWTNIGDGVSFQGRYDASGSRSYNQMIPINDNDEWDVYKELVNNSRIKSNLGFNNILKKRDLNSQNIGGNKGKLREITSKKTSHGLDRRNDGVFG
jgi:hypothetical protein